MMISRPLAAFFLFILSGLPVMAFELHLGEGATQVSDRPSAYDSYHLPVGVWEAGALPTQVVEGAISRQTWRIDKSAVTTLQILAPLRAQLIEAGFDLVLECQDSSCGGFDFRFATEVIPAPDMYVDIRNYRFLSAQRGDEALSLIVSRTNAAGFVQVIHVAAPEQAALAVVADLASGLTGEGTGDLASALAQQGFALIRGADFDSGSVALSDTADADLAVLAQFAADHPKSGLMIVGHTDAQGALATNISLSKQRAQAVRTRLIERFGVHPAQVQAEGMGYLAPRHSNLDARGREANRRVEVVLLPQ